MGGPTCHYECQDHGVRVVSFLDEDGEPLNSESVRQFFAMEFLNWAGDHGQILIDLAGVGHLDSAALGPLVQALRRVRSGGGSIALCNVHAAGLREILTLTRFDHIFPIFESRSDAIRNITAAA